MIELRKKQTVSRYSTICINNLKQRLGPCTTANWNPPTCYHSQPYKASLKHSLFRLGSLHSFPRLLHQPLYFLICLPHFFLCLFGLLFGKLTYSFSRNSISRPICSLVFSICPVALLLSQPRCELACLMRPHLAQILYLLQLYAGENFSSGEVLICLTCPSPFLRMFTNLFLLSCMCK